MTKHVVGSKILKKEQVLISVFLTAILVISSGSMVAFAKNSTYVVKPSGDTTGATDTAAIQAALNRCTGGDPRCTVQLLSGTYYIASQITVYGFQGSFVGAGQGQTNIMALGNMPSPNPEYNIPCEGFPTCTYTTGNPEGGVPFWAGLPGPSNPWPALFTFEGGSIAISGMTITDTSPTPISPGWYLPAIEGNGLFYTTLQAAIYITGLRASSTIDHVSIVGAAGSGPLTGGYNIGNGILIDSTRLPGAWTNPDADLIQLTGTFSVTNSFFDDVQSGVWMGYLLNSNVAICGNTVSSAGIPTGSFYPIGGIDISNTNVLICRNQGTVPNAAAIFVAQSIRIPGLLPSTVTITGNNFQVIQGANAVVLQDAGEAIFGTPVTLNAVISGNTFQNSYDGGSAYYYSAIATFTLKSTTVSLNNIAGGGSDGIYINGGPGTVAGNTITGADTGLWLDMASDGHVVGNVIANSVQYGISVTSTNAAYSSATTPSSNNVIAGNLLHNSGTYDLYWDGQGTGDVWCHNIYQTSNPSPLPSC